jgi:hypothetical protein
MYYPSRSSGRPEKRSIDRTYSGRTTKYSKHYITVTLSCTEHACSGEKIFYGKTKEWDKSHNSAGHITVRSLYSYTICRIEKKNRN